MQQLDTILEKLPDGRQETDGSIVFECPICRVEGHANKQAKLFANGAIAYLPLPSAGSEENRAHCNPLREMLGLDKESKNVFIKETLLDGKLTLELTPAARGKVKLAAHNSIWERVLAS